MAQASTLLGSHVALPSWKSGSFDWKQHLRPAADALRREIDGVDAEAFAKAVEAEARLRIGGFLGGIAAYREHPYRRDLSDAPVVWQQGSTRLCDYSAAGAEGAPVLVIPSLINRGYILDLTERHSLVRYLAARGLRPFLVDWGAPGVEEQGFGLDDYVAGRLSGALDAVADRAGPPVVLGYCMGGLLGLGLGILRQDRVKALALLATPWDFHAPTPLQGRLVAAMRKHLEDAISLNGELPLDLLQCLFTTVDPGGVERKFRAFAGWKRQSVRARNFVALEDWLNDGVPLAAEVARQCLFGWYVDNLPGRGQWRLAGTAMKPRSFLQPALVMVPTRDRIVPPGSALALAEALPRAYIRKVETGHIGMMTGARAKTDVYGHLARWLLRIAGC